MVLINSEKVIISVTLQWYSVFLIQIKTLNKDSWAVLYALTDTETDRNTQI